MKSATLLILALLGLAACAEMNRPIEPGDPWLDQAEGLNRPMVQ